MLLRSYDTVLWNPLKILKQSLKNLSNASKNKEGALNVPFSMFSDKKSFHEYNHKGVEYVKWRKQFHGMFTIFCYLRHNFSIYKALWASRYRGKTTTTTITISSSMEVFFYLLRLSSGQEGKLWFPLHPPPSIHPPAIQSWFCSSQHWVKYKLNRSNQSPNPDCYPRQPLICGASKSYSSSTCRPLFLESYEKENWTQWGAPKMMWR